jgi:hypothetical protein
MKFEIGSKAFIIESSRIVREVTVVKQSGNFYIIRFEDGRGGIQVRNTRLYHTREDAEATLPQKEKVIKHQSPYDYWH